MLGDLKGWMLGSLRCFRWKRASRRTKRVVLGGLKRWWLRERRWAYMGAIWVLLLEMAWHTESRLGSTIRGWSSRMRWL